MVLHSVFDPQEMEKEKGVVVEEINMSEDTPEDVAMELAFRHLFRERSPRQAHSGHPGKRPAAFRGTRFSRIWTGTTAKTTSRSPWRL